MAAIKIGINLIPRKEFAEGLFGKILEWILSYGRYVIILTFIITLSGFLYKFKLTEDLETLSEDVKSKQVTIQQSYGDLEVKTHVLQDYLATVKKVENENVAYSEALSTLSQFTPQDVIFTKVAFSSSRLNLSATALSLGGFALFIENLKASKMFSDISLAKVGEGKTGIDFTLSAEYKKTK